MFGIFRCYGFSLIDILYYSFYNIYTSLKININEIERLFKYWNICGDVLKIIILCVLNKFRILINLNNINWKLINV